MSWAAYVVLTLAALTSAYFLWTAFTVRALKGVGIEKLEDALPGIEEHKDKAVVYCFSEHCGPCRKMTPEIDRLQAAHPNVFKLDVSRHPAAARRLGIRATPTSLLVENGKVHKALLGSGGMNSIEIFLDTGR